MRTAAVQRLRITFGVDGPLRYLSVLDMGRLWERLLRRAGLPLAFTQGFNPHPRLAFATPLPVGYSSTFELLDAYLGAAVEPAEAWRALAEQCPAGLRLQAVSIVPLDAPALQAVMRRADYEVSLWSAASAEEVSAGLQQALDSATCPPAVFAPAEDTGGRLTPSAARCSPLTVMQRRIAASHDVCRPQGRGPREFGRSHCHRPWAICRTGLYWDSDTEV